MKIRGERRNTIQAIRGTHMYVELTPSKKKKKNMASMWYNQDSIGNSINRSTTSWAATARRVRAKSAFNLWAHFYWFGAHNL